ncbi:hypothetical protein [Nocardioides yefusunii]|uniref:Uncharacterized protein n=1 Tax=Nocardioides yefusunii TaxID=2500546 RepID=A0ABW1QZ67_9ACTN|nr:hypothetical protein [Nocardioides yefusunii]
MDLLNPNPSAVLPQAMWLLHSAASAHAGLTRESLLDLVLPKTYHHVAPSNGHHVRAAFTALQKLGLFTVDDGVVTALQVEDHTVFIRHLRHRLIHPADTFGPDHEGAPSLVRGLRWLLKQPPAKALHYSTDIEVKTDEETRNTLKNKERWNIFRPWCYALGFGHPALSLVDKNNSDTKIMADPTPAVVDVIWHPFGEPLPRDTQIPISQLLDFLRRELPVLPDGTGEPRELHALGHALLAAARQGVLDLAYESDAPSNLALPYAKAGETPLVSAVTIRK